MSKASARLVRGETKKEFARIFDSLCDRHSRWSVWADFVTLAAISISNTVDQSSAEHREQTYMSIIKKYRKDEAEKFTEMFAAVVVGMDENPNQDFLGELYMSLDLGNQHVGQFFTPYDVCAMMSEMTSGNLSEQIKEKGWIGVSDPACGAGALLVAFVNECIRQNVNYHDHVLFVAQDVDFTVAMMCYIQLSLLGCAGYVVVDNTLTKPSVSYDRRGLIPKHSENVWYTPFYFKDTWHFRRIWAQMDMLFKPISEQCETPAIEKAAPAAHKEQPVIPEQLFVTQKNGQITMF